MELENIPPPTYDATSLPTGVLIKEVERLKRKASTDPEFRKKVKDAFIAEAGSNGYEKKVRDDTDKFTKNIVHINYAFEFIGKKLHEVDQQKLKGPDGKIWKFENEWNGLQDQWKALFDISRETALKAMSRAEEIDLFCDGILDIASAGDQRYKDTLTEIDSFIKKPDQEGRVYNPKEVEKQTKAHSKAYEQLKSDLTAFKVKYGRFAEFVGVRIGFEAAVLNAELAEIEAAVLVDRHLVLELGVGLDATAFTTLAGGIIVPAIGPLSIGGVALIVLGSLSVVGEGSGFLLFLHRLSNKESKHDSLKDRMKDKETSMDALEAVKFVIENRERDTGLVISQLDLIRNTWLIFNHEANLLRSGLQKVVDPPTLKLFKGQVKNVRHAYSTLGVVLSKISNVAF